MKYKSGNTNREILIGNTGWKIQIGKYTSDNTNREIQTVKLQIEKVRIGGYQSKIQIGQYKSGKY